MLTEPTRPPMWAKVIDQTKCVGCHACTTACKSENEVPLGVTRTYVKSVDVGVFPQARRSFQVTRCNQCDDAPCVAACPTTAMFRRPDGIVDFDKRACIGCKACIAACPYDAIFINPEDHSAEKCNFCAHRLDVGLEPACVVVCPVEAIIVGDLNDPTSRVAQVVDRQPVVVRRPEKATRPKLFYRGAHEATLDPLAARRPEGGIYAWAEQPSSGIQVGSGVPSGANSSAAALISYDVSHEAPWGWRVSAYIWAKGLAAGAYLVPLLLALLGLVPWDGPLWRWVAPIAGGFFLALTGALLIWDLKHPERFLLIFRRPQWRSWLVRGAFVISAYGVALAAHLALSLAGAADATRLLAVVGGPLALMTAVYTAYLLAQAKARDLWQSPLLPIQLTLHMLVGGAAVALLGALVIEPDAVPTTAAALALAAAAALALSLAEATVPHPTRHAALAAHELRFGRFAAPFWIGHVLVAVSIAAPAIGPLVAPFALAGLALHEHAHVQAGQSVPLA